MEPVNETAVNETAVATASEPVNEKKGITGSTIKIIAIVTMFIDHFAAVLLDSFIESTGYTEIMQSNDMERIAEWMSRYSVVSLVDTICRCIGRLAFPLFIFLLVEGFVHTHNKLKYAERLFIFALISEIPFNLALTGHAFSKPFSGVTFGYQSVYWTLLAGFLFMCAADIIKQNEDKLPAILGIVSVLVAFCAGGYTGAMALYKVAEGYAGPLPRANFLIVSAVCAVLIAILLVITFVKRGKTTLYSFSVTLIALYALMLLVYFGNTDYDMWGVLAIALGYAFRNGKKKTSSTVATVTTLSIMQFIEAFAFFDLLFIKNYNGKRGLKLKYVFYAFYPVHLFLLYTISWFMGWEPGKFLGF